MSLLWPSRPARDPSPAARVGRVIHWIAMAICVPLAALFVCLVFFGSDQAPFGMVAIGTFVAALFFGGRAVRYMMAGE